MRKVCSTNKAIRSLLQCDWSGLTIKISLNLALNQEIFWFQCDNPLGL